MSTTRPPRSYNNPYRSTRERPPAPRRRATTSPTSTRLRQRGSGCGTIVLGLVLVIILLGFGFGFIMQRLNQAAETIVQTDTRPVNAPPAPAAGEAALPAETTIPAADLPTPLRQPFNVLLVGVDKRAETNDKSARSDTLIVVHVDPQEQWASMLSIPRDSVVTIPHLGRSKINAAYTYGYMNAETLYGTGTLADMGGGMLAAETVERFLGVNIDYITQVDFHGFELIVDALGGITVNVTRPLIDAEYPTENFGRERIYIPAGLQVFDGKTALRYARSRHSGSDFDRSHRQQQVLRAVLHDVQRRGLLEQVGLLPDMLDTLEQNLVTTMPINDLSVLRGLAQLASTIRLNDVTQFSINPNNVRIVREEGSDIYWDQEDVSLLVGRWLAGPEGSEMARVQVQNGANVQGLATRYTGDLETRGFLMVTPADAPLLAEHTMIIDYRGYPRTRQRLATLLNIEQSYVYDTPPANAPPTSYQADIIIVLGQDYQEHRIGSISNTTERGNE